MEPILRTTAAFVDLSGDEAAVSLNLTFTIGVFGSYVIPLVVGECSSTPLMSISCVTEQALDGVNPSPVSPPHEQHRSWTSMDRALGFSCPFLALLLDG